MPIPNLWRKKFNPDDDFVVIRKITGSHKGDPLVKENFSVRRLEQMYNNRMILPVSTYNDYFGAKSPAADKGLPVVDPAPVDDGESDNIEELREQYEQLTGEAPDKRWGEKRLTKELDAATLPGVDDGAA